MIIVGQTLVEKRQAYAEMIDKEILSAVEFELAGSVAHAGGVLTGFSVKYSDSDCLLTLRAEYGSNPMICFVGCPDLGSCFRKAVTAAYSDELKWREDKWANNKV